LCFCPGEVIMVFLMFKAQDVLPQSDTCRRVLIFLCSCRQAITNN